MYSELFVYGLFIFAFSSMTPSNTTQEWLIEGRRLVPLMPRLVPQTAFTVTANQAANMQAEKNASLPSPSQTGVRENLREFLVKSTTRSCEIVVK